MRLALFPLVLLGATSVARADALTPIDTGAIPEPCRALAVVPASAQIETPNLSAHLSVANCAARVRMDALSLTRDDASFKALEQAAAPSLAILDDVAAHGPLEWRLIALASRGDLYQGMAVRMRNATHGDPSLEPELKPWIDRSQAAFEQVVDLARANPSLEAGNPVIASYVRASTKARSPALASTAAR